MHPQLPRDPAPAGLRFFDKAWWKLFHWSILKAALHKPLPRMAAASIATSKGTKLTQSSKFEMNLSLTLYKPNLCLCVWSSRHKPCHGQRDRVALFAWSRGTAAASASLYSDSWLGEAWRLDSGLDRLDYNRAEQKRVGG